MVLFNKKRCIHWVQLTLVQINNGGGGGGGKEGGGGGGGGVNFGTSLYVTLPVRHSANVTRYICMWRRGKPPPALFLYTYTAIDYHIQGNFCGV